MVELLIRQDKMTMAHSLETRVPFLDRETVDLARRLPTSLRVRGHIRRKGSAESGTKILLKKLAERRFGRDFCYRRKMGFGLPLGEFLRDRRLQELWNDSLQPSMARRGWVEADVADGWIRQVVSGAHGSDSTAAAVWATEALWSTISLELWAQVCIDGEVIPAGNEPVGPG
jgi:asparagine synthase (glutamine-hydrolysing)